MLHFLAGHPSLSLCLQQSIIRHWESIHRHLRSTLPLAERLCLGPWWGGWYFPSRRLRAGWPKTDIFLKRPEKKAVKVAKPVWMAASFSGRHHFYLLHHLFRSMTGKMAAAFFSPIFQNRRHEITNNEIKIQKHFTQLKQDLFNLFYPVL